MSARQAGDTLSARQAGHQNFCVLEDFLKTNPADKGEVQKHFGLLPMIQVSAEQFDQGGKHWVQDKARSLDSHFYSIIVGFGLDPWSGFMIFGLEPWSGFMIFMQITLNYPGLPTTQQYPLPYPPRGGKVWVRTHWGVLC